MLTRPSKLLVTSTATLAMAVMFAFPADGESSRPMLWPSSAPFGMALRRAFRRGSGPAHTGPHDWAIGLARRTDFGLQSSS